VARSILGVDIETKDVNLKELGPGVYRHDGDKILGVSLTDDVGLCEYIDLGHDGLREEQRRRNVARVKELLSDPCPKLGANLIYDADWIQNWLNVKICGPWIDVQTAEALINEYRPSYSLDALAERYLGRHKEKDEIAEFCAREGWKGDPRSHLWKMPYSVVEGYAKADTALLLPIWKKQKEILESENLMPIMDIEVGILPMLVDMRRIGVRIDEEARKRAVTIHEARLEAMQKEWNAKYPGVNTNSTKQLAEIFTREGIHFDVSPAGKKELLARLSTHVDQKRLVAIDAEPLFKELKFTEEEAKKYREKYPSITHDIMERAAEQHPLARFIVDLKQVDKLIHTFLGSLDDSIDSSLVRYQVDGRAHPSFYPTSSDDGGARTGRFSSAKFNAQQIPKAKKGFDPLARDCFIPEDDSWWCKADLNSAEYRVFAHYASGPGAEAFRQKYLTDETTDMHKITMANIGCDRDTAKKVNFSVLYFTGKASLARKNNWTLEYASTLMDDLMETMPFIKVTRDSVVQVARNRGYIRTILGRRCRVSEKMRAEGRIYPLFNSLIQGGVGDILKKAMFDAYKAGVFAVAPCHITCHDEIDVSAPKTKEGIEAMKELKYHMENCVPLKVPMRSEVEVGPNWGKVDSFEWSDLYKEIQ